MNTPEPGTPTQVAHPWKAVLRTFVAAVVGVALGWLARTMAIDLAGLEGAIVDSLTGGAWLAATGLAQWLLSHPRLQGFWRAVGLSTGVERERPKHRAGEPYDYQI